MIRCKEIRLIDERGNQLGVVSPDEGLRRAIEAGLDLVEVAPNAIPPVCKIIDFGKFRYEQEKLAKEAKKKQAVVVIKEVRIRPNIEEHDYQVKLKSILRFLDEGDKVKVTMTFKGREISFIEKGRQLLDRIMKDIESHGQAEKLPSLDGRMLVMMLTALGKGER